jgi:hypothetical protein
LRDARDSYRLPPQVTQGTDNLLIMSCLPFVCSFATASVFVLFIYNAPTLTSTSTYTTGV